MWFRAVSPSPGRPDSLRALAMATLVLVVAIGTVEAARQAHINIPRADLNFPSDISSNRRFVVGSYCMRAAASIFFGTVAGSRRFRSPALRTHIFPE